MTLTELRYIVALAQEGNFSRAAEHCSVSQPTLSVAIARLEADHAPLNPDSESYDPDLVELVLSKQRAMIQGEGLAPSAALSAAAKAVMARFGKAPEPVAEQKGLSAQQLADRKQEQVKKNLNTASRQPASMKGAGLDSDKGGAALTPDINSMTQEEFRALPASTLAKLRGDFV